MRILKIILINLIGCVIFTSCLFDKQNKVEDNLPFKDVKIESVKFKKGKNQNYVNLNDSIFLRKINKVINGIESKELIKGRRQHGAKNLFSLKLVKDDKNLFLFINETKDEGMTIDFFEEDKEDNFNYFMGCLYESNDLMKLLNERLTNLNKI